MSSDGPVFRSSKKAEQLKVVIALAFIVGLLIVIGLCAYVFIVVAVA